MSTWLLIITLTMTNGHRSAGTSAITIPVNSEAHCKQVYHRYKENKDPKVSSYGQCLSLLESEWPVSVPSEY